MNNNEREEKEEEKSGIILPSGIVVMAIVAILCVIISLIGSLVEYCQTNNINMLRALMRILSILGWSAVEWYLVDKWWEYRKQKKTNKQNT